MADIVRYSRPGGRRRRATPRARNRTRRGPQIVAGIVLVGAGLVLGQTGIFGDGLSRIGDALGIGTGPSEAAAGTFVLCDSPPHADCVIDGDTFYLGTDSIRVADIDTPETHPARCAYEEELGERATVRLMQLLNAGPFEMALYDSRDEDQYGRKLRVVSRDGRSLGDQLVAEGLAREWTGSRQPWCA